MIQKRIDDTDYTGHLNRIKADRSDLVCFHELSTTGCLYKAQPTAELDDILKSLEPYDFGVMIGFPYRTGRGLFNAYMRFCRGRYQIYRKVNLFRPMDEHLVYEPGSDLGLFEIENDRLGVAICYDLRFPDIFSRLAEAGATKVFVPAAFPRVRIDDWRELLTQRARENRFWVIGINAVGDDGRNEFGGSSMAVDPEGRVVAQADETTETVLTVDV